MKVLVDKSAITTGASSGIGYATMTLFGQARAKVIETARRQTEQLRSWRQRAAGRRNLAQLDTRMLRDIGVTHLQARDEWQRPFWRH